MPRKPISTTGYQSPKVRAKRVEIALSAQHVHGLPRIVRAHEGWIADPNTLEVELEAADGQRVIVPLSGDAVEHLLEIFDLALKSKNTAQE